MGSPTAQRPPSASPLILLWIPRILTVGMAWIAGKIMTVSLAESCDINGTVEIFKGTKGKVATPFDIFFNKIRLLWQILQMH